MYQYDVTEFFFKNKQQHLLVRRFVTYNSRSQLCVARKHLHIDQIREEIFSVLFSLEKDFLRLFAKSRLQNVINAMSSMQS